jgi:hypothetical protein
MKSRREELECAIEVFVHGHSAGKSSTFPYEAKRVQSLWVMRDAPRRCTRGADGGGGRSLVSTSAARYTE